MNEVNKRRNSSKKFPFCCWSMGVQGEWAIANGSEAPCQCRARASRRVAFIWRRTPWYAPTLYIEKKIRLGKILIQADITTFIRNFDVVLFFLFCSSFLLHTPYFETFFYSMCCIIFTTYVLLRHKI